MWGVPLSVLTVFALNWHQPASQWLVAAACLLLVIQAFRHLGDQPHKVLYVGLAAGLVLVISMAVVGRTESGAPVTAIPYALWGNRGEAQMNVWVNF